jgi:hypothetical protein
VDHEKLSALFVQERNKHLSQLMAINGRAAFAVLTIFASTLVGLKDIDAAIDSSLALPVCALILLAAAGLAIGAAQMSRFHTGRIRHFEERLWELHRMDFAVIPREDEQRPYAFHFIFMGTVLLIVATVGLLYIALRV